MPIPASDNALAPASRIAGEECRFSRSLTNQWSWASVPDHGNTHLSSATPAARAASTEHTMNAADWSVSRLAFMALVYGKPIQRLSAVTVAISSVDFSSGNHACGLRAATELNRDHNPAIFCWCASIDSPAAARRAFSNTGYTWMGSMIERAISASL